VFDLTQLQKAVSDLASSDPQAREIQARLNRGEITEEEATLQIVNVLSERPEIEALVASLRPPDNGQRLPRLDPLVQAGLVERLQFDGDVPEMRTGKLLPEASPAVPVVLTGRSPVAGGWMLQQASAELGAEVHAREAARMTEVAGFVEAALPGMGKAVTDLARVDDPHVEALVRGTSETDHPEYRRGQVPLARVTLVPSGSALAKLTPEESKEAAWKLLSTTQGRRSAQPVIEALILKELRKGNLSVEAATGAGGTVHVLAAHSWSLNLSGKGSTQSAFSFLDMAGKVLAAGLRAKLPLNPPPLALEVFPLDQLADRVVGWSARVFARG
jgi:hypothetical protein